MTEFNQNLPFSEKLGTLILFPHLYPEAYSVSKGEYKILQGSDAPLRIERGKLYIMTDVWQHNPMSLEGVLRRGLYTGDAEGNVVVSFLYHKRKESGELETEHRVVLLTGIGFGEHPGHSGQPPSWYLIGAQLGTLNPDTDEFTPIDGLLEKEIVPKHFSIACVTGGPLGEPLLANAANR